MTSDFNTETVRIQITASTDEMFFPCSCSSSSILAVAIEEVERRYKHGNHIHKLNGYISISV